MPGRDAEHAADTSTCRDGVSTGNLFNADANGNFSRTISVSRAIRVHGLLIDCAAPSAPCVLGVADFSDVAGTADFQRLTFAPVTPLLIAGHASVPEGDSGTTTLAVPVSLSFPATTTVTVQWETLNNDNGTACSNFGPPDQRADSTTDYTPASGTITFAPGETRHSAAITAHGNALVEPDECVLVVFHSPMNDDIGVGTIVNDDRPIIIVPGGGTVAEGNSGTTELHVAVTLLFPSPQTVTAQWRTHCTCVGSAVEADPSTDYTPANGTVTFAPGQTEQSVAITVKGDTLVEPDEWIVVQFTNPTNATIGGYGGLGFGVILNDDHATVLPNGGSVVEPTPGTATLPIAVTLSNPSTQTVTAQWNTLFLTGASGVQATPNTDYTPASGTVTFAPGQTSQTVPIEVRSGILADPYKIFVVSFHNPTNAKMGGYFGLGFGFILGNTGQAQRTALDPTTLPQRAIEALTRHH